jgi:hypothetical protein
VAREDLAMARELGEQFIVVIAPNNGRVQSIIWEVWAQGTTSRDPAIRTTIVNTIDEAIAWLSGHGVELLRDADGEPVEVKLNGAAPRYSCPAMAHRRRGNTRRSCASGDC